MKRRNKIIIAASLVAAIGVAGVTIGTTTALFSRTQNANVHINAGSLNVGFYLTELKYDTVVDGEIVEKTVDLQNTEPYKSAFEDGKGADLGKLTNPIATIEKIFPTMGGQYTFMVYNSSDIAVDANIVTTKDCFWSDGSQMGSPENEKFVVTSTWTESKKISPSAYETGTISFVLDESAGSENPSYESTSYHIDSVLTATQITKQTSSTSN